MGAALGLLLAPQTGAETRNQLGERGKALGQQARELADRTREVTTDLANRARKVLNQEREAARQVVAAGAESRRQEKEVLEREFKETVDRLAPES